MDQASRLRALSGKVSGDGAAYAAARFPSVDTRIIAVTSGKGGVGKTTVAVNLALLLAERGLRTLIVDADLGLANVDIMLGLDQGRHIGHLLLPGCEPGDIAMQGPLGIAVISGGSGLRELAEADESQRALLLEKLRAYYAGFDCVVIDTSPGIGADVTDFLREAQHILLVTTPEPTSLRDTYAAAKAIAAQSTSSQTSLLVNMKSSDKEAGEAVKALNRVVEKFLDLRFADCFSVETDPMVGRAIGQRRAAALLYPRSPAVVSLRRLASTIDSRSHFCKAATAVAVEAL
jgi:flagellar biosynthesis protein FlhG